MIGSIILFLAGCLVSAGALWFRFVRERFGLSVVLTTIANIAFVASLFFLVDAACAAELPGPAAMAPVTAAPSWWAGLVSALLPDLVNAAVVGVLMLVSRVLLRWSATLGLKADGYTRTYLERAGQRAIDLGYQVAGVVPGQSLADAQLSAIMSTADAYLRDRVPDALKRFGLQKADALSAYLSGLHAERVNWALTDSAAAANAEQPGLAAGGVVRGYAANAPLIGEPGNARSAIADLHRLAAAARGAPVPSDPVTGLYREADGPRA